MAKAKMTTCKVCGAEVASSAETCPNCGARLKKKKRGFLSRLFLGLLILGLIGYIVDSTNDVKPAATPADGGQTERGSTETVELAAPEYFGVGEGATYKDITVTLVDVSESKGDSFFKPTSGNVFLTCEFLIENNSTSEIAVSSLASFDAYCDDYSTNLSLQAMTLDKRGQLDGKVVPGKKMRGVVGYEVAADWQKFEIEYSPSFWGKAMKFVATK